MSLHSLFPHPDYAEEQPLHHTILTYHVLHRGFQAGAFIGLPIGICRSYRKARAAASWSLPTHAKSSTAPKWLELPYLRFTPIFVRTIGSSCVVGTGLIILALIGWMYGRETIEWKDRSWRLLANAGQMRVDDWSLGGMATAVTATAAISGKNDVKKLGWKGGIGVLGLGTVGGLVLMEVFGSFPQGKK
ncbi:MAG: hypothetical protein M1834_007442 [Cirrosporium novae-zelandiae]|nr:MAG: hypothetical protein M1834_007442 [Cirrosporium novae-zelandiae]